MSKYRTLNFYFHGWIAWCSDIRFSKYGVKYVIVKGVDYEGNDWDFIIFENQLEIGIGEIARNQFVKIEGVIKKNDTTGAIFSDCKKIKIINKNTEIENEDIDELNFENATLGVIEYERNH